jgi:hypothetical protein
MRLFKALAVFALGAIVGVAYYAMSWRHQLPYLGLNWLGPLIGVDGEKGYDTMLFESAIDFGLALLLVSFLTSLALPHLRRVNR